MISTHCVCCAASPLSVYVQSQERVALDDMLHTCYGQHLFGEGHYDEAMAQFGMCSYSNPVVLLRLFPSLACADLLEPVEHLAAGMRVTSHI